MLSLSRHALTVAARPGAPGFVAVRAFSSAPSSGSGRTPVRLSKRQRAAAAAAAAAAAEDVNFEALVNPFMIGVMIEREPVTTRIPGPFEAAYKDWTFEERNRLSRKVSNKFWQRVIENEKKSELDTSIEQWVPASRITEADETNDTTSVNRSLDKCLYFVVKNRKTGVWTFPAFKYNPDTDTTYDLKGQVSRFMTRSFAGSEASRFWVTSDWPAGTFIHPAQNMKTYIYHANWIKGPFVNPRQNEFAWFTKDELREHLPKETFDRLEPLFFDYTF